jgi:hypothetical protein
MQRLVVEDRRLLRRHVNIKGNEIFRDTLPEPGNAQLFLLTECSWVPIRVQGPCVPGGDAVVGVPRRVGNGVAVHVKKYGGRCAHFGMKEGEALDGEQGGAGTGQEMSGNTK